MKRPVVLALNPSIDAEWRVDGVRWEEKNNVLVEHRWAGGKGVNVARWLNHLGAKPLIILPLGGDSGKELSAGLRQKKILAKVVPIREATRVNVIVTTPEQGQLRFNPLGPKLSKPEWHSVVVVLKAALSSASCLILSGSLPRGLPVSTYATVTRLAHESDVPVLLDCDGPALVAAVRARPFLVKPNEHELEQWALETRQGSDLRSRALAMSAITGGWVLVSRGGEPGLLVNADKQIVLTAKPPRVKPLTTVGAGDALLAGVASQLVSGRPPESWLRVGLDIGAKATQLSFGRMPE